MAFALRARLRRVDSVPDGITDSLRPLQKSVEIFSFQFAHLAQSVEHTLGKGEVAGSIPVVGTI